VSGVLDDRPTGLLVLTGSGKLFGCISGTGADAGSHEAGSAHFLGNISTFAFWTMDTFFFSGKDQAFKFFFAIFALVFKNRHMVFPLIS
jgi:hypothetical protein